MQAQKGPLPCVGRDTSPRPPPLQWGTKLHHLGTPGLSTPVPSSPEQGDQKHQELRAPLCYLLPTLQQWGVSGKSVLSQEHGFAIKQCDY